MKRRKEYAEKIEKRVRMRGYFMDSVDIVNLIRGSADKSWRAPKFAIAARYKSYPEGIDG